MFSAIQKLDRSKGVYRKLRKIWNERFLWIIAIPALVWYALFSYWPMWGVIIAFKRYNFRDGMLGSPWVGLENFIEFVTDFDFSTIMINTLGISILNLLFSFPAPIILALLLNELRAEKFKRIVQTISYLPHFVSWVIVAGISVTFLSPSMGPLVPLLHKIGLVPEDFVIMIKPNYFWGLMVVTNIWKGIGFGAIIYLAAISGVDQQLYESAVLDGAGRWKQAWHITIPSIKPVVLIMLILNISQMLNSNFDQLWLFRNDAVLHRAEVIDTHVFVQGIQKGRYDYATAIGLFRSVISIIVLFSANKISQVLFEESLW